MPYDENGRWVDSASKLTPTRPAGGGGAPPTRYEEGGAAGGLPPVAPFPGMGAFQGGGAAAGPQVGGGMPAPTGARTVFEDATEAAERLMGFLVVLQSREEEEWRYFRLKKGVNFIGRFGSRCEIELRDREASQQHALLVCTNAATRIIDLDSSNGTFVQGRRLEIAQLAEGNRIRIGRTTLMYVPFPYVAED